MREPDGYHKLQYILQPLAQPPSTRASLSAGPFPASAVWTGADHHVASCAGGRRNVDWRHRRRCVACRVDVACSVCVAWQVCMACQACVASRVHWLSNVRCQWRVDISYAKRALCANFIVRCMAGLRSQMCNVCPSVHATDRCVLHAKLASLYATARCALKYSDRAASHGQ